jgi:site-specific DNA recombinase
MKYVIYCRKSTDTEDRQVQSLESQETELVRLAENQNLQVMEILKESMSAKSEGRPVFKKVLDMITSGKADGIICWKLDRLARNFIDGGRIIDLSQRGLIKEIHTSDGVYLPNDNVLMIAMQFGMANQYSRDLSNNVKRGLNTKLEKGEWPNKAPFGYLNDQISKKIIIDPVRSKYVVRAFDLYKTGGYGLRDISRILFNEGLRTNNGKQVLISHIARVLTNPFYMGMMLRNGKYFKGNYQPLISKEVFDKAQFVAENRLRPKAKRLFFPLRGFLKCENCGCMLTASLKKGHHYYYCTNGKRICDEHKTYLREKDLYLKTSKIFKKLYFSERKIELMYKASKEKLNLNADYSKSVLDTLQLSLESLKAKESTLLDTYLAQQITKELYDQKVLEITNDRTIIKKQIEEAEKRQPAFTLEPVKKVFLDASVSAKQFLDGDDAKKRKIIENLLWNFSIKDKNIVNYQFKSPYDILAKAPKNGSLTSMLTDMVSKL